MEGLRGWLAWWVVVGHLIVLAGVPKEWLPKPARILLLPGLAVDVFVILSGFVIFMTIDRTWCTLRGFLIRRFLRLYPVFLLCFLGAAALEYLAINWAAAGRLPDPHMQAIVAEWQLPQGTFWSHLLLHLTMLHGAVPDSVLANASTAILAPAWSISLEWQFYLFAPALFFASRRDPRWLGFIAAVTVACALVTPLLYGESAAGGPVYYTLPSFLPLRAVFFFAGAASYFFWRAARAWSAENDILKIGCAAFVLIAAFTKSLPLVLWLAVLALHLLLARQERLWVFRLAGWALNAPVAQWAGRISYSTYLCHGPVICAVLLVLHQLRPHWPPALLLGALLATCVPLILLISHLLFHYVETPFNMLAKQLAARVPRGANAAGLAVK